MKKKEKLIVSRYKNLLNLLNAIWSKIFVKNHIKMLLLLAVLLKRMKEREVNIFKQV